MKVNLAEEYWTLFKEAEGHEDGIRVNVPDALFREYVQLKNRLYSAYEEIADLWEKAWEQKREQIAAEAEAQRDVIRAETRMRQQATPHAEITEQSREYARKMCEESMKQYIMMPIGEMPRGIVYADSPLRKKDEDAD